MNTSEENEIKKEFQLERVIFFSDAVFAIIITIMVLDVKLPEVSGTNTSERELYQTFLHIIPRLTAYTVSFIIIGGLWMKHLKMFSFLKDFNPQLIALNLLFLFSISLSPFALSFAFVSTQFAKYPWGIYTYIGIFYFTYLTQTLLIAYLIRNKYELCVKPGEVETALKWKIRRISFFAVPAIIVLLACANYFHLNMYIVFAILVIYRNILRLLQKRYYPKNKHETDNKLEKLTLRSFFVRHGRDKPAEKLTNLD